MNLLELKKALKNNNLPNSFEYKGNWYVMDYYDMKGHELNYGSKDANKDITIYTPNNRYDKNFKDMRIEVSEKTSYRYDINYERTMR